MSSFKHLRRLVAGAAILIVSSLAAACSGDADAGSVGAEGDPAAPASFARTRRPDPTRERASVP